MWRRTVRRGGLSDQILMGGQVPTRATGMGPVRTFPSSMGIAPETLVGLLRRRAHARIDRAAQEGREVAPSTFQRRALGSHRTAMAGLGRLASTVQSVGM